MKKDAIMLFKEIIEIAYKKSTNDKVSFYLHLMDILDLYDVNITIERKNKLKKEYDYGTKETSSN